jgi:hypothetical protein
MIFPGATMTAENKPDLPLIVQSIMALMLWAALCFQIVTAMPLSELLIGLTGVVSGYYFGTRQQASLVRGQALAVRSIMQAADQV